MLRSLCRSDDRHGREGNLGAEGSRAGHSARRVARSSRESLGLDL
jgi:hypothetical protein